MLLVLSMVNTSEDLEGLMWAIHCICISICMLYGIVAGGGYAVQLAEGDGVAPRGEKNQYDLLSV